MSFLLDVSGDLARFTNPAFRGQGITFDIPTPSALIGIIKAVYWHNGINYYIKRFWVLNKIDYADSSLRLRKDKIAKSQLKQIANGELDDCNYSDGRNSIVISNSRNLCNVHYIIEFDFTLDDTAIVTEEKVNGTLNRLLSKKFIPCYYNPSLGVSDFPARINGLEKLPDDIPSVYKGERRDFGWMPLRRDFTDANHPVTVLYNPIMIDGCVDVEKCEVREL